MSKLSFGKYQGAGNDFILIDDRALQFDPALVPRLCHRRLGIGADGVILLQNDPVADFRMRIFNSDGSEAESCGNGLRCLFHFALDLGICNEAATIATQAGIVRGELCGTKIAIEMDHSFAPPIRHSLFGEEVFSLNTGVPHAILFYPDVQTLDVETLGRRFRNHPHFAPRGTNVNFAALLPSGAIRLRTFERGVEGETLSCGTGAIATALVAKDRFRLSAPIQIECEGGTLQVSIETSSIRLIGEAANLFSGCITC